MFASHNGILLIEPFVLQAVRDNFCTAAWRNLAHGLLQFYEQVCCCWANLLKLSNRADSS